jgi:hypothetical protein
MAAVGRFFDKNAPPMLEMLSFYALIGAAPGLGIYGALCTLKRKRYAWALAGAGSLAIPLIGPWCGLTLPLAIWWLVLLRRQSTRESFVRSSADQSRVAENAEDAIALAVKLEADGDWEAAISQYRRAASRWPEHTDYINNCIEGVRRKQAVSS